MRNQPTLTAIVAVVMSLAWAAARAETAEDCVEIQDRAARLACFDRVFPRRKGASEAPPSAASEVRPAEQPPVVVTEPVTSPPANPPAEATPPAERSERERRFGLPEIGGLFGGREPESITSRVVAVRQRDKQKMVFLLENDQIWIQVNPRDLPIEEGERVTVSSTLMGGHMLRTEHGVATRVNRIR